MCGISVLPSVMHFVGIGEIHAAMKVSALLFFLAGLASTCTAAFPTLHLKKICDDQLHAPTNLTHAGDGSGRLFICDQPGRIYIFQHGMLLPVPFLDLSSQMVSFGTSYTERGLLGLAFHPGFADPESPGYRRFYVNYSAPSSHPTLNPVGAGGSTDHIAVIAEFQVSAENANAADPASKRIVLTYGQPQNNHNGGQLEFGPDGMLYIGSGDGGGSDDNQLGHTQGVSVRPDPPNRRVTGGLGNSQDRRNLLGKILRIDPLGSNGPGGSYGIPADNPFLGQSQDFVGEELDGPVREEIYAYGLRNPWKFSFDASFGGNGPRLICADVGQGDVEELDFILSGGNYGWRMKEGSLDFDLPNAYLPGPTGVGVPSVIGPIAEYAHPNATFPGTESMPKLGTSITGGYVYRGSAFPALQGKYLCADYAFNGIGGGNGIFIGVEETAPGVFSAPIQVPVLNPLPAQARIYAFGLDESGEMYVAVKTTSGVLALDGGKPAGILYQITPPESVTQTLTPNRDNTLYETSLAGVRSNGKGPFLYAGKTGSSADEKLRRALVRFDLASVPADAVITGAAFSLKLTLQVGEGFPMKLHKVTADWGEGNSNAGSPGGAGTTPQTNDATWHHRFFSSTSPVLWSTPGGDFTASPSATILVGNSLTQPVQTWSGAGVLADVESWRATPAANFGWIVIGEEVEAFSAQRFGSRENSTANDRPKLALTYASAPAPTHREAWLALHYPDEPVGFFLDPDSDTDGDGVSAEFEYAYGLNPHEADEVEVLSIEILPGDEGGTDYLFHFHRDAAATDVTLILEMYDALAPGGWKSISRSVAGTPMLGENGANIMTDDAFDGTRHNVTVRIHALDEQPLRRGFGRLRLERLP